MRKNHREKLRIARRLISKAESKIKGLPIFKSTAWLTQKLEKEYEAKKKQNRRKLAKLIS